MLCFSADDNLPEERCVRGIYREVTIPRKLVYTWKWDGSEEESLVTAEFLPFGSGTLLRIEHSLLASQASKDGHAQGWGDCLAGLDRLLAIPGMESMT